MPQISLRIAATVVLLLAGYAGAQTQQGTSPAAGVPRAPGNRVYVLPVDGPIDKSMAFIFRRAFREMEASRPAAVVVEIDTPGGSLGHTDEIIQRLREILDRVQKSDIPTYAYVNHRALSAGAIVSLACDKIYMAPLATIGSAAPVSGQGEDIGGTMQKKVMAYVLAMVRALAQDKGHAEDVAMAMVDPTRTLHRGAETLCKEGELLNLTAEEAIRIYEGDSKPLLATAVSEDIEALLDHAGIDSPTIVRFEETPAEKFARWLTLFGPFILSLALLALFIEFKTPGFAVPGITGLVLLAVYFFGHYVAGLAGLEDIALVVVGLVLLALELFVIPGFGVVGVLGILCIGAGLFMGLVPHLPGSPDELPELSEGLLGTFLEQAMMRSTITVVCTFAGIWLLSKVLPRTSLYGHLVLQQALPEGEGRSEEERTKRASLVGKTAVALTPLHPSGIVRLDGKRLDVITSGDLIGKGATVRVVEVSGNRVVVVADKSQEETAPGQAPAS